MVPLNHGDITITAPTRRNMSFPARRETGRVRPSGESERTYFVLNKACPTLEHPKFSISFEGTWPSQLDMRLGQSDLHMTEFDKVNEKYTTFHIHV